MVGVADWLVTLPVSDKRESSRWTARTRHETNYRPNRVGALRTSSYLEFLKWDAVAGCSGDDLSLPADRKPNPTKHLAAM